METTLAWEEEECNNISLAHDSNPNQYYKNKNKNVLLNRFGSVWFPTGLNSLSEPV